MWDHFIAQSAAENVFFVAHSYGGLAFVELVSAHVTVLIPKLFTSLSSPLTFNWYHYLNYFKKGKNKILWVNSNIWKSVFISFIVTELFSANQKAFCLFLIRILLLNFYSVEHFHRFDDTYVSCVICTTIEACVICKLFKISRDLLNIGDSFV